MVRMLRLLLLSALLALTLALAPLHHAGATLGTCGSCVSFGPIIHLSDGTKINTGVQIQDTVNDVASIHYSVHIPQGVGVVNISYQGSHQVYQKADVFPDLASSNTYEVTTTVKTNTPNVPVYPFTRVDQNSSGRHGSANSIGLSNHDVSVEIKL